MSNLIIRSVIVAAAGFLTWSLSHADLLDDLPSGHWLEVPNTRLDALDPENDPGLNPDWPGQAPWHGIEGLRAIMDDWSTATYDSQRDRVAVWGGGHAGYAGNEVYVFDLPTLQWLRLTNPSVDVSTTGNTLYTDGLPRARETYNYMEYVPQLDRMVSFGGANLYPGSNVTTESAAFDFDTHTWNMTAIPPHPGTSFLMFGAMAVLDQTTGHVWLAQPGVNAVQEYNPFTNAWSSHSRNDTLQYRNAAIDERNRYLIWTGRHNDLYSFDLDNPDLLAVSRPTSGDTGIQLVDYPGMTWDPVSQTIIAWGSGTSVHSLDTDGWTWTRIDADAANTVTPTAPNSNGTHGRFRYIPSRNAFFLVNDVTENVYFFKLPVADTDGDGVADNADNCIVVANEDQCDTDGDGYGNLCDADLDDNLTVNSFDLNEMRLQFGATGPNDADLSCDGTVNSFDLSIMRGLFGQPPGPSGIVP